MKRLKNILLNMESSTETYVGMYEGPILIIPSSGLSYEDYDNIYYNNLIGFRIERTHKLALDKPTITIQIPVSMLGINDYTIGAADYCLRAFKPYIDNLNSKLCNRSRPDKENGKYYLYTPGGEVLIRNTAYFMVCTQRDYENGSGNVVYLYDDKVSSSPQWCICIRLQVQLPYKRMRKTIQMLCRDLPGAVNLFLAQFDFDKLEATLELEKKQLQIRNWLKQSEYCAFIANGSILPRFKGTDLPMDNAIPFKSALEDEIQICGVRGMGIKRGVTVITGGGYSGKSTLLDAISAGIYNHIEGDGRELCITDDSAVTISAEDGRSVKSVNVSPFIKWIPNSNPNNFSTDHASGSTSQASNIMEAVNFGAKLLLIDEDKSATNFMIQDVIMKELIEKEPLVPFTDRVNELYQKQNTSTILVIGGSGEYLSVADNIYMMDDFAIYNVTKQAKKISKQCKTNNQFPSPAQWLHYRTLLSDGFSSYPEGSGSERLEVSDMGFIFIGNEVIDIRSLHNIISFAQINTLGFMLLQIERSNQEEIINVNNCIDNLYKRIETEGLDCIFSNFFTTCERFMDLPRKYELYAVINRMRKINFRIEGSELK